MKFFYLFFCFLSIVFLTSCVSTKNKNYKFNQKYSANQVKEDIAVMRAIYEKNHPSMYWYNTKQIIDSTFDAVTNSIVDSLTETQAKNKIASIINAIKCGHTSVSFSKQFVKEAEKHKYPQFPLSIKVWKDSMVVLGYYNKADSMLKRGTIIKSINGKNINQLTQDIFPFISTDGNGINHKYQVLSGNFPAWYRNVYGVDSLYKIQYFDSNKNEKTASIKWHVLIKDTTKKIDTIKKDIAKKVDPKPTLSKREQNLLKLRSSYIDTSLSTAFLKLNTFSKGNLNSYFDNFFEKAAEQNLKNVVIDVRDNGGGRVASATYLLRYLKNKEFKIADSCFAKNRNFANKKYIKGWFGYWCLSIILSKKEDDGFLHFNSFENDSYKPFKKNHFKGNIFLIQGGYSFSAATIFTSFLKGQENVTVLGEETGGGYYGNTAMLMPNAFLPNTKLKIRLPLYRYVMDKNRPKGEGVKPDVQIDPSSEAIKKGVDLKMEKVKEMIKDKNKTT